MSLPITFSRTLYADGYWATATVVGNTARISSVSHAAAQVSGSVTEAGSQVIVSSVTLNATIVSTNYDNAGTILFKSLSGGTYYVFSNTALSNGQLITYPNNGLGDYHVACFASGTLILTTRGARPVERLAVGDAVVTAAGETRTIRWIGHRRIDGRRHPRPEAVMPIRIRAGAVAENKPARDLLVSPDHAVAIDGVLIAARRLVNGVSVLREDVARVTYWHVELDRHDLLLAEGLEAESYIEAGNRAAFENGGAVVAAHADFEGTGEYAERTCLPVVTGGEKLRAVRAGLFARAASGFTADPGLRLLADGIALAPLAAEGGSYRFAVPEGTASLRLISRSGIAGEVQAESGDRRRFGVLVRGLFVDGTAVSFDALGEGWNAQAPGRDHRWTDGDAALPLGRAVAFRIAPLERYPLASGDARRHAA